MNNTLRWLSLMLALLITGCAGNSLNLSDTELYRQAQRDLNNNRYLEAIEKLEQIEDLYPFGYYAQQAQLELIYAHFEMNDEESAVIVADRFVRLNPDHPQVDYAWYMRGLATDDLALKSSSILTGNNVAARDMTLSEQAFRYFEDFLVRFPDSEYAQDARYRMYIIRDRLARHELVVANYYLERAAWVASANRALKVIQAFDGTPAVADALAVLVTSYQQMELDDLAAQSLELLKSNFPDHASLATGQFKPLL